MAEQDTESSGGGSLKGGRGTLLIIVLIALVAGAGGSAVVYFFYQPLSKIASSFSSGGSNNEEAPTTARALGVTTSFENLTVNPAGTDGTRYLMVSIVFEAQTQQILDELTAKEVAVKDTLLHILSSKTVPELSDMSTRNPLRERLREATNAFLTSGQLTHLYFTQYVMQ